METIHLAFDLEGTLVDLEPEHIQSFAETARKYGVVFGPEQFHHFVGAGDRAISTEISRLITTSGVYVPPQEIELTKQSVYEEVLFSHSLVPREGVNEYLETAAQLTGNLVLVSLTTRRYFDYILEKSGLRCFFGHFLHREDVTNLKPHPEVYQRAASLLSCPNKAMVAHKDSPSGVAAAKASGSPAVAFPVHENLLFDPEPDLVFKTWIGVEPKAVIDSLFGGGGK